MKRSDWWLMVLVLCMSQVDSLVALGAVIIAAACLFYYSNIETQEEYEQENGVMEEPK